jgi:hypothetical protein
MYTRTNAGVRSGHMQPFVTQFWCPAQCQLDSEFIGAVEAAVEEPHDCSLCLIPHNHFHIRGFSFEGCLSFEDLV